MTAAVQVQPNVI